MSEIKKIEKNPTALIFMSLAFMLLGIGGIIRLINTQSAFDVIIGIALTLGLVGGILGFKQYLSLRTVESDKKLN